MARPSPAAGAASIRNSVCVSAVERAVELGGALDGVQPQAVAVLGRTA
ncbi:hypothetical protein [Baekduia soli]|nr:hypothetical protein [Baekduia soli]